MCITSVEFVTDRQRSCKKVMFSKVFVCQRGGCPWYQVLSGGYGISDLMFLPGVGIGGRGGTYQGEEECVRAVGMHLYWPKRSFGQGNIFTPVCHSVHRGGVPDQARPPDQAGTRPMTRYTPGTRQVHHPGPGRYTTQDQAGTPRGTRYTPLDQVHPPDQAGTSLWDQVHSLGPGRYTPRDQEYTPRPGRYTPWDQVHPLGTRQVHPLGPDRYTSPQPPLPPRKQQTPEYGQRSAGTHPTGMHTCTGMFSCWKCSQIIPRAHSRQAKARKIKEKKTNI